MINLHLKKKEKLEWYCVEEYELKLHLCAFDLCGGYDAKLNSISEIKYLVLHPKSKRN